MHVHGKYKAARYEEGLSPHGWCVALVEVHFSLAVSWNASIVCEIFRDEHSTSECTRWHAISLKLFVGVGKICLMVWDLL